MVAEMVEVNFSQESDIDDLSLVFHNLSISVKEKTILHQLQGEIENGKMTCILGSSGAGKSTFMNFISGRLSQNAYDITGDLYAYGSKVDPREFRDHIAYVEQEDSLLPLLTPRESVDYACQLRTSLDAERRSALVEDILEKLKLTKCADTYVGGKLVPGISGGQKKRTAIAQELVFDPEILFLDEPTSGLDSFNAMNTMSVIKELTQSGKIKTVVATIHQPSSQLFHLFDNVLILSEGRIMYLGPIAQITDWTKSIGKPCPYGYNFADHVLDVIESATNEEQNAYRKAFESKQTDTNATIQSLVESNSQQKAGAHIQTRVEISKRSFFMQWWILANREFIVMTRDTAGFFIGFLINLFISCLVGTIFWQVAKDAETESEIQSRSGAITFACINTMFLNAQPTLLTFQFAKPVFIKEYQTGLYGVVPYFLGRILMDLPKIFFNCLVQLTIVYNMIGFSGRFMIDLLCIWLMGVVCASLALVLGCVAPNVETALQMVTLVFVPQIIFCGFFVGIDQIPNLLKWANYLCALKYSIAQVLMEEFDPEKAGSQLIYDRFELDRDDRAMNYFILIAMFLFCQILAATALKYKADSH